MPKRRTHQTPCEGRRSTTTTWEGGALGGKEAGRNQRPQLCNFSSVFLIFATQVGHHPSQPALQLPFIATPEGGAGGDRGVRAEPKAPPKSEDSKMEALVAIKGKEELCSKCERGPPRTCKIIFMLLLFSFRFLFRK